MDAGVPLFQVRTVDQVLARVVAQPRLRAWLLALFAGLAGLLAALGVYGVVSYVVQQRTAEIGVRMALGASRGDVRATAARPGHAARASPASAIGLAGAWGVSRALGALLFGVTAGDVGQLRRRCGGPDAGGAGGHARAGAAGDRRRSGHRAARRLVGNVIGTVPKTSEDEAISANSAVLERRQMSRGQSPLQLADACPAPAGWR